MANDILAKMAVKIAADTAEFKGALAQTRNQLKQFSTQVSGLAAGFGIGVGVQELFNVVKDGVKTMMDFEKEMSTVKAITGATDDEFKKLRKSALDLGASTRYTSKQVAELQVEYGRLGFTTKEILAATSATLDLATATGSDLARSADVAGSTVRGFGLSADETRRVVDVMAESFNKSALGIENFSEAMKYVAPIASQAGLSVEETTALLGTLADAGIRGSQAGTSLRKIITDLGAESGDLAERIQKLAAKGLTGADAMDEVGRTAYASLLILAENSKKTKELTQELNYAAGAGKKAAEVMGDNLAGDLVKLSSAYDGLVLSFSGSTGVLREITQNLTQLLNVITNGSSKVEGFASAWMKVATFWQRTFLQAVTGVGEVVSGVNEANAELREQEQRTKIIEENVKAAFANGSKYVWDYLDSIKGVRYEKEITLAIFRKWNEQIEKENKILKDTKKQQGEVKTGLEFWRDALKKVNEEYDKQTDPSRLRVLSQEAVYIENQIARLERIRNLRAEINNQVAAPTGLINMGKVIDDAMKRADQSMTQFRINFNNTRKAIQAETISISSGIAGAITEIATAFGEAAAGAGNFGQKVLEAVATFAQQLGAMMIATGLAEIAFKSFSGPAMIVAGAALVAAAAAVKASIKNRPNLANSGTSTARSTSGASSDTYSGMQAQNSIVVEVQGVVRGQDIWLAGQNYSRNKGYTSAVNG